MAEDHDDRRKDFLKELAPWTKLFSAFKIALDPKKLVLAAGGILVMSLGWYVLSVIFFSTDSKRPEFTPTDARYPDSASEDPKKKDAAWEQFKHDRQKWYLLYEMAGAPTYVNGKAEYVKADIADECTTWKEFEDRKGVAPRSIQYKPYGKMRVLPWFEDRGPNPYLLVKGDVQVHEGDRGFIGWLVTNQLPVLLEPLVKFFQPIVYLIEAQAGFLNRVYLLLVILWSLATWAFFGGAITRIAAVQVARTNERVSLSEAVKFVMVRYKAYFTAPLFPLLFLAVLTLVLFIFGLLEALTGPVGDVVLTIFWPIVLLIGLIMAVVLVGLVGWPLMYSTISAEGSDSFDAISRSYSYVYQAPWQYIWYSFVALAYGAVLVFFVGLMGSLTVNMAKWGVTLAPTMAQREPSYLFAWAPTSFGWRDLLLHKSPNVTVRDDVSPTGREIKAIDLKEYNPPVNFHNYIGMFFVSVWLYLLFLLIVGFGYSYFWTASTIIYLLIRQKVDDTEMDEVHLEEEPEQPFPSPSHPPTGGELPKPNMMPIQMVDSPQLRSPASAANPAPSQAPISPSAEPAKPTTRPEGPA